MKNISKDTNNTDIISVRSYRKCTDNIKLNLNFTNILFQYQYKNYSNKT